MKRTLVALAMGFASIGLVAWAAVGQEGEKAGGDKVVKRTVIEPQDTTAFKIQEKTHIVRVTGKGIAGAIITAKVNGPAKISAEGDVIEVIGGRPLIGPGNREFEITPTGKGKVTVEVTVKNPNGANPPDAKYEFEVVEDQK